MTTDYFPINYQAIFNKNVFPYSSNSIDGQSILIKLIICSFAHYFMNNLSGNNWSRFSDAFNQKSSVGTQRILLIKNN